MFMTDKEACGKFWKDYYSKGKLKSCFYSLGHPEKI